MSEQKNRLQRYFPEISNGWAGLSQYRRFERVVSLILSLSIGLLVLVAMFFLISNVFSLLFVQTQDPFNFRLFQAIFDMVLTILIAMEFNNSIVRTMEEEGRLGGFIHVEVVVLIAIMAVVRKFMVMDVEGVDPMYLLGLGGAILALGGTYWLLKKAGSDA
ncbi:MAG: phosphate-starvation-inducible PsiE family protein [Wenzhouxiangella sp.]